MTRIIGLNRRSFLHGGLAGAAVVSSLSFTRTARAAGTPIKIGFVSPKTGPLAPFGEADDFVVTAMRKVLKDGIQVQGTSYPVEIIVKDSQSNPNRAADVAAELILKDGVQLMVVSSTPETVNPVADQCESNGIPCISTVAPWQPWFFGRGGKPDKGFEFTYHFFWGLEDVIATYIDMWGAVATNKAVGGMFPNDGDGNAWGDANLGFPKPMGAKGYSLTDPGRYQNMTDDFTAQIGAFKAKGVDILTGVMIPPDAVTFINQLRQQGLAPKVVSIGKALLFPSVLESMGKAGHNLSTEVWWTPGHPFASSLTGQSAKALATEFTTVTRKQWTQPIGFAHALFEVAVDTIKRAAKPTDPQSLRDALAATKVNTVVGPVNFAEGGPMKNVSKTPLVGGQWRQGGEFKYDLVVTSNVAGPAVAKTGTMQPL